MESARQVIRWTIPGWLFVLLLFVFDGVRLLLRLRPVFWEAVEANMNLTVAFVAAGLPIGFLIYQVYFWEYWVFPFPTMFGLGQPRDRGKDILRDVVDMDLEQMAGNGRALDRETPDVATKWWGTSFLQVGGIKDPKIMKRYRHNWLLQNFVWRKTLIENDAESLDETAVHYSDIYHSLGASRWSLVLAFFLHTSAYIYIELVMHPLLAQPLDVLDWRIVPIINFVLLALLFWMLTSARYDTLETLVQFKHDFITYFCRFPQCKENEANGTPSGDDRTRQ
jgi:hypothetical protein